MADSLFRATARGREPLAGREDAGDHVHYQHSRRVGIGCITSRRTPKLTFHEYLALRLGVTLTEAIRLHNEGRIN
jgi:hypothetical protein